MIRSRKSIFVVLMTCSLIMNVGRATAGIETIVPVSAELSTSIAGKLFPITVKLGSGNLFLTDPTVLFLDDGRIGIQLRMQAYDHRPAEGIAISETGSARLSGWPDYDPDTRQILLHDPEIDELQFDQDSPVTRRFRAALESSWSAYATNPIRSDIPPHPYLVPFKDNIRGLSYDGERINLRFLYE